jgi:hypothetical protein
MFRTHIMLGAVASVFLCAGCATRHFSEMFLYDCKTEWKVCDLPREAGINTVEASNPIYVREGAKVSLETVQINPGWIHQDRKISAPNKGGDGNELKRRQAEHLNGKELWIVTRIASLTANSPLELEGKHYYKVSNVKFGVQSFRSIPLDLTETRTFTHTADAQTSYRVLMRVYEVDGFDLKRALLKTYRDNPGISGIVTSIWDTVVSTVGSLAGDAAVSVTKAVLRAEDLEDPLVVESLLLEGGASLELEATLHLFTKVNDKTEAERQAGWQDSKNYLLYDKWKSEAEAKEKWDYSYSNRAEYLAAQEKTERSLDLEKVEDGKPLVATMSFIRLVVSQSEAAAAQKPQSDSDSKVQRHQARPVD